MECPTIKNYMFFHPYQFQVYLDNVQSLSMSQIFKQFQTGKFRSSKFSLGNSNCVDLRPGHDQGGHLRCDHATDLVFQQKSFKLIFTCFLHMPEWYEEL